MKIPSQPVMRGLGMPWVITLTPATRTMIRLTWPDLEIAAATRGVIKGSYLHSLVITARLQNLVGAIHPFPAPPQQRAGK